MDAKELEQYDYQLTQVQIALRKDPTSTELLNLQTELQSLIDITREYLTSTGQTVSTSKPSQISSTNSHDSGANISGGTQSGVSKNKNKRARDDEGNFMEDKKSTLTAGSECLARANHNSKFLPARITSVGGTPEIPIYSVVFKALPTSSSSSTSSASLLTASDIKPLSSSARREMKIAEEQAEREKKRAKTQKKIENRAAKNEEQVQKQSAWQSFANKAVKKGVEIPGIRGDSIFKSPDSVAGKVGVVGSGKGMTETKAKARVTKDGGVIG